MRDKVAIVGGGVAGLSAAHELMERGFEVHVYDRRSFLGGKAASYRVSPDPASKAKADDPPGEHGFRFFPGWYRHLTDTMARIPYHRAGGGRRSVADNLVSVKSNLLAWYDRSPISLPLRVPSSVNEAVSISNFLAEFGSLGITTGEIALFVRKMLEFVVLPDEKRVDAFEHVTWWDYLECSKPGRSRAYQDFVRATTRTMVAAKAEQVSAYSIGRIAIRTLLDTLSTLDRVLNGPTAEVWIDPWVAHLEARGVKFHTDLELKSIAFDRQNRKVKHLVVERVPVSHVRRLRRRITESLLGECAQFEPEHITEAADALAQSVGDGEWNALASRAKAAALAASAARDRPTEFAPHQQRLLEIEGALADIEQEQTSPHTRVVDAQYYVLALPLEQLAYYVNRTSMLTYLAPDLSNTVRLSRHLDWMAGIQFYFERPLDIAPGHLVGLDSDWALTAIEQTQFWDDVELGRNIKSILSVDISAWNKKGRKIRKEAFNCDADEIAEEVWAQLSEMLNKPNRADVMRKDMLVGGSLKQNVSYHLDDTIVERYDRKKQAAYERARGLELSTLSDPADEQPTAEQLSDTFMWGRQRLFNAEPLLINRIGTRKLRPSALTSIANLFIAGDYVKTETDLACMEGANEAARRAVNGILEASSSREPRCELWAFSPPRQTIEAVMAVAAPMQVVRNMTNVVARWQDRFFRNLGGGQ